MPDQPKGESFTCPKCGRTSYHPKDVEAGYCGACHWWTGDPFLAQFQPEPNDDGVIWVPAKPLTWGSHKRSP